MNKTPSNIPAIRSTIKVTTSRLKMLKIDLQETVANELLSSNMSCRDLAKELGCSAAYISDLQNKRRNINDKLLERMSAVLGTKV